MCFMTANIQPAQLRQRIKAIIAYCSVASRRKTHIKLRWLQCRCGRACALSLYVCFQPLRRDRYQPEIKLYYVEKHMTVDLEDEEEDKLQSTCAFEAKDHDGPIPAMPHLGSEDEASESEAASDVEDEDAASNSSKTKGLQGLQRELALEAPGCSLSQCVCVPQVLCVPTSLLSCRPWKTSRRSLSRP